jgi:Plant transposon protein
MDPSDLDDETLLAIGIVILTTVAFGFAVGLAALDNIATARRPFTEEQVLQLAQLGRRRRRAELDDDGNVIPRKRAASRYDHAHALFCVNRDYFNIDPCPIFNDRQFERFFRISRERADYCLQRLAHRDPFFTHTQDALGNPSIDPKVKLLMALKCLGYGVSPSAFQDYFQMGESTGIECIKRFCRGVVEDDEIKNKYLRKMNREDAKKVSALHQAVHGVAGLMGALDCMHCGWRLCPKAWAGHFTGKEQVPTIVLEAFCDYNLWIWHASFGWAGSLNDLNIWDRSDLYKTMQNGIMAQDLDFEFVINGETFTSVYWLVDMIYPALSRFVNSGEESVLEIVKFMKYWQEAARKDIERGFGVLQRKFHMIVKPFEFWFQDDIAAMCLTCVALHNMMVELRVQRQEQESPDFYEIVDSNAEGPPDPALEVVEGLNQDQIEDLQLQREQYTGLNDPNLTEQQRLAILHIRTQAIIERWNNLNDFEGHHRLRNAIMHEVYNQHLLNNA